MFEMAARACPGAAECSKWPLGLALEPQNARNGRSGVPRSVRMREMALGTALEQQGCQGRGREGPSQLAFEMAARRMPSSGRLLSAATSARLHLASCMDMHRSALMYIVFDVLTLNY